MCEMPNSQPRPCGSLRGQVFAVFVTVHPGVPGPAEVFAWIEIRTPPAGTSVPPHGPVRGRGARGGAAGANVAGPSPSGTVQAPAARLVAQSPGGTNSRATIPVSGAGPWLYTWALSVNVSPAPHTAYAPAAHMPRSDVSRAATST